MRERPEGEPKIQSMLKERIRKLDTDDLEATKKIVELLRERVEKLDKKLFKETKEAIRGKQLIPPELDLAFLDQHGLKIYLNTDTVPPEASGAIIEHEAAEMVYILSPSKASLEMKRRWREAHRIAVSFEYRRAREDGRFQEHHQWIVEYVKSLKEKFPADEELMKACDRQLAEREEIFRDLTTQFKTEGNPSVG